MNRQDELDLLSPPGDTILETLKHEFAVSCGWSDKYVDELLVGKAPLTKDTAALLQARFGIDAEFWIRREAVYREQLAALTK